jgi:hypothetical protein
MPLNEAEKQAIIDLGIFKSYKKGRGLLKEGRLAGEAILWSRVACAAITM